MAKKAITKLSELTPDAHNYNKGTEFGGGLIEKSLRKLGAGRSILLDKNGKVIAGNKTLENAVNAGFGDDDLIVVQTTGKQIVAVQRMDLDLDSKMGKEMALADNATAKANIEWDADAFAADWSSDELSDWGIEGQWGGDAEYPSNPETITIRPYCKTHILLSFSPAKLAEIQPLIEQILQIDGIEYEQGSN